MCKHTGNTRAWGAYPRRTCISQKHNVLRECVLQRRECCAKCVLWSQRVYSWWDCVTGARANSAHDSGYLHLLITYQTKCWMKTSNFWERVKLKASTFCMCADLWEKEGWAAPHLSDLSPQTSIMAVIGDPMVYI